MKKSLHMYVAKPASVAFIMVGPFVSNEIAVKVQEISLATSKDKSWRLKKRLSLLTYMGGSPVQEVEGAMPGFELPVFAHHESERFLRTMYTTL
jgi:hypothetical protein